MDWKVAALGSAVFAGLTVIFGKIGVKDIPSNLATWLRTWVILVFLGLIVVFRGEWQNPMQLNRRCLVFLFLSAITTGLSWLCYYRALQTGPASLVAPVDKLSLAVAMLLAFVFLGERINLFQGIGVTLVVAGTLLVIMK